MDVDVDVDVPDAGRAARKHELAVARRRRQDVAHPERVQLTVLQRARRGLALRAHVQASVYSGVAISVDDLKHIFYENCHHLQDVIGRGWTTLSHRH